MILFGPVRDHLWPLVTGGRQDGDGWRWKLDPSLRFGGFGPWRPEWQLQRIPNLAVPFFGVLGLEGERDPGPSAGELAGFLDACFEHTILVNDLLSYRKEYVLDEPMNAVGVLCRTRGLGLQQAVDELCARLAAAEDAFFAEAGRLRRGHGGRPGLELYLEAWGLMLSGNLAWSLSCPRYNGSGGGWLWEGDAGTLPDVMVLHQDRTEFRVSTAAAVPARGGRAW